jgi:hypothetical protein
MSQEPQDNQMSRSTNKASSNDTIFQLVKLYQNAPPILLGVVIILGIVSVIALAVALSFVNAGNQNYALVSFIGFILFAVLAIFVFQVLSRQLPPQKIVEPKWERLILKYPPNKLDELERLLSNLHAKISKKISNSIPSINAKNLRTKVFLPQYDENKASDGYVCTLVMPYQLRIGMNGHPDEDLELRPGEGISGKAFVMNEPKTLVINDEPTDVAISLDVDYMMFPDRQGKVSKDIKWIISIPLTLYDSVRNLKKAVGVLSLDCLHDSISNDECEEIESFLLKSSKVELEGLIAQCETIRLYVGTQEK